LFVRDHIWKIIFWTIIL